MREPLKFVLHSYGANDPTTLRATGAMFTEAASFEHSLTQLIEKTGKPTQWGRVPSSRQSGEGAMTSNVKTITAIQRALQIPEIAAIFERVTTDDKLISDMMAGVNLDDEADVDAFARVNFNLSGTQFMWGLHHSEAALHVKRALDREARIRARITTKPHRKAKGTIQLSPTAQETIRFHIAESGLKTPDYAEKCKLSARTLQRVLVGGIATYKTLHCIARVMHVPAGALLPAK